MNDHKITYRMATFINSDRQTVCVRSVYLGPHEHYIEITVKPPEGAPEIEIAQEDDAGQAIKRAIRLSGDMLKLGFWAVVERELGVDWRDFVL